MKHKFLILILIMFSAVFTFGQKKKYKQLKENVNYYEISADREKVYILCNDSTLHVYDTKKDELKHLFPEEKIVGDKYLVWGTENPILCTDNGLVYITSIHYVYKIKDEKLYKIPFLYEEYRYGSINTETIERDRKRRGKLSKTIKEFDGNTISKVFENIYILENPDGNEYAFYSKTLKYKDIDEDIRKKVESNLSDKNTKRTKDTTYYREDIGSKKTYNYFENKKIVIKEKAYMCKLFQGIMRLIPNDCKYKIKVITENKTVKLKDRKYRDNRKIYKSSKGGDLWWNCDLYERLPYSKHISDKEGNIYLLFFFGKNTNLIKIQN